MNEEDLKRITKEAHKEALKEWLDEKFAQFGRWSVTTIAAMVLAALIYFMLFTNGWQKTALPKL